MKRRRRSAARKLQDAAEAPFTIQCIWRLDSEDPDGYEPGTDLWHRGDESALSCEMRLWSATERWSLNRILEGQERDGKDGIKPGAQGMFGINSRYANDAYVHAKAIVSSQRELIPMEIEDTEAKLAKASKKQKADLAKGKRLRGKGCDPEADRVASVIAGRDQRIAKLEGKLAEYRAYQEKGTIPPVVFGGKALWRKVTRGQATKEEWQAKRRGRLYSRGDSSKGGNPNIKVLMEDAGTFSMSVALSHLTVEKQNDNPIYEHTAPRITGELWVPSKFQARLAPWLASGVAYSVELIRDGAQLRAHITGPSGVTPVEPECSRGVLAFDTNPNGLGFYNVDSQGNRQRFPDDFTLAVPTNVGKYPGDLHIGIGNGILWVKVPDWTCGNGNRRDYMAGVVAKLACDAAAQLGKPLACEGLDFKKAHDTNHAFNRMSSNFPSAKILEAIARRAGKTGVGIAPVNPAFTSAIGRWRYMTEEGLSVHQSAAKVIGRRALGKTERFDPNTRRKVAVLRNNLIQQAEKAEAESPPAEGTRSQPSGIAKRLTGSLREERLVANNGRHDWKRLSKFSPWGGLVECQRYPWARAAAAGAVTSSVGVSNRSAVSR